MLIICRYYTRSYIEGSKLTSNGAEAQALIGKGTVGNIAKDLPSVGLLLAGASNEAILPVEVAKRIAVGCFCAAEASGGGTRRDIRRVSLSVAQRTIGCNVDLLATGNDDAEAESLVASSEGGDVAWRAVLGSDDFGWAVRGWALAAEIELSTTCVHGLEVDGRCAALGDDAEVGAALSLTSDWLGGRGCCCSSEEGGEGSGILHLGGVD